MNDNFVSSAGTAIDDDMCGAAFRVGDIQDLAAKLAFLMDNPEAVEHLGASAHARVAKYHDWDRIASLHLDTYREML